MSTSTLSAFEINPPAAVTASVICLHGLGADGHDLKSVAAELRLPLESGVRFVFPDAPYRPVTVNNGTVMRAWYDILDADLTRREDSAAMRDSERLLGALIQSEMDSGIESQRIVLAGFSQGGAIALYTGLRYPQRLAGVAALSAYLPLAETLKDEASPSNKGLPIMMAHGTEDGVVPVSKAAASRRLLCRLGYDITWRAYPMPHTLCAQEMRALSNWLARVLSFRIP